MRSLCNWLAGSALAGLLIVLTSGCGGSGNSGLAKPPEVKGTPDMSAMPGADPKTGRMQPSKAK
jgi:hypothetical protein